MRLRCHYGRQNLFWCNVWSGIPIKTKTASFTAQNVCEKLLTNRMGLRKKSKKRNVRFFVNIMFGRHIRQFLGGHIDIFVCSKQRTCCLIRIEVWWELLILDIDFHLVSRGTFFFYRFWWCWRLEFKFHSEESDQIKKEEAKKSCK